MLVSTRLLVRELGTVQYEELNIPQTHKNKCSIEQKVQEIFKDNNSVTLSLQNGKVLRTDQDFASLVSGQLIEAIFANKFYWVPSPEQIHQWKAEFANALEPGQTKLRG